MSSRSVAQAGLQEVIFPEIVIQLQRGVEDLRSVIQQFSDRKTKLPDVDLAISTIDECTTFVRGRTTKSSLNNLVSGSNVGAQLNAYLVAIESWREMLHVEGGIAHFILEPARILGLEWANPKLDLFVLLPKSLIPRLSRCDALYGGFKVALQGMANMAEGAPWPWKALPQTALQFITLVQRCLDQPHKIRDLADIISRRMALLLEFSQRNGQFDRELNRSVETFFGDLQRIMLRLRVLQKLHPSRTLALAERTEDIIAGEIEKMREATLHFLASLPMSLPPRAYFSAQTAYTVTETHAMVSRIHANAAVATNQTNITRQVGEFCPFSILIINCRRAMQLSRIPPSKPVIFHGRTELIGKLVNLICHMRPARIAIIGAGGIVLSYLASLPQAMLVLDNLETLWFSEKPTVRNQTALLLEHLASITSLVLVITSRAGVAPNCVQWSNADFTELPPISLDAALDTFIQTAGRPEESTELFALETLLRGVDFMPLAITLLAQLAQLKNPPSELLRRWQTTQTKSIRTRGDHREYSVDISIRLSLDMLMAATGNLESLQLLSVCAHLPDGLRPSILDQLRHSFENIDSARDLLVEFALVTVGPGRELRMLSPVRQFMLVNHPTVGSQLAALRRIYLRIAASGPKEMDETFAQLAKNVVEEYGNLTSFLQYLISVERPSQEIVSAVKSLSQYSFFTFPSVALCEALRSRLGEHPAWLADCLESISRLHFRRSEISAAMATVLLAENLNVEIRNRHRAAWCRLLLGQCHRFRRDLEFANQDVTAALAVFLELGDEQSAASCRVELGDMCRLRGEYDLALGYLTPAREVFERLGVRLRAAQCTKSIGQVEMEQKNLSVAEKELKVARIEFEQLGEQLGAAQCTQFLGRLRHLGNSYDSAENLLVAAETEFSRLGTMSANASCLTDLARLQFDQKKTQQAFDNLQKAKDICLRMGNTIQAQDCDDLIALFRDRVIHDKTADTSV
ncbi:hypothetical protein BKA62DRAFT_758272 [Auriculariales sp. MPI-PUGE-AT-0066]|nr:hypothetical protein BKA62DRAFT_758272 [Auriculariales sp. MPI-PUGE-AT-0066]